MEIIKRFACRAILLTPEQEVLLMKIQNPDTMYKFWITPGGGIEQDEDHQSNLKRELFEEVGLSNFNIGAHVWNRQLEFEWEGRHLNQKEAFYLIKVKKFNPVDSNMVEGPETRAFKKFKWWNLTELQQSSEIFAPRELGEHLNNLINNGTPEKPITVGK